MSVCLVFAFVVGVVCCGVRVGLYFEDSTRDLKSISVCVIDVQVQVLRGCSGAGIFGQRLVRCLYRVYVESGKVPGFGIPSILVWYLTIAPDLFFSIVLLWDIQVLLQKRICIYVSHSLCHSLQTKMCYRFVCPQIMPN